MSVASKILKGLAGTAAISGTAYGAGKYGYKAGAKRTADQMTLAFADANQRENQHIANSFKAFNAQENRGIAQAYFKKGLVAGTQMQKKAALEEIYSAAYMDELEKVAINWGGVVNTVKKSFSNLGAGAKKAYGQAKDIAATPAGGQKSVKIHQLKKGLKETALKSKAALGTIAGTGIAAMYAAK